MLVWGLISGISQSPSTIGHFTSGEQTCWVVVVTKHSTKPSTTLVSTEKKGGRAGGCALLGQIFLSVCFSSMCDGEGLSSRNCSWVLFCLF